MTTTVFVDGTTPIIATWLNDVNTGVYTTLPLKTDETSATGSIVTPVGTTAQRDGVPAKGYLRYNSTTDTFEGYAGSTPAWGAIGGSSANGATNLFAQTSLTVAAGTGQSLVGPVTFSGTLTVSGRLVIL